MIPTAGKESNEKQGWFGQKSLIHSKGPITPYLCRVRNNIRQSPEKALSKKSSVSKSQTPALSHREKEC